uniref:AH domain-containing protein n=1 Tax=Haemonchus placei TaxID=6290 RepID=A0A0N4X955_HAEPC
LSYCLKLKEMDDEELEYHSLNEGLYRVETGNYEYRLMLRCRQETRQKFIQMRNDVMIKIELLDQKHVRDIAQHLANLATVMKDCLAECSSALQNTQNTPIEIDIIQVSSSEKGICSLIFNRIPFNFRAFRMVKKRVTTVPALLQ